MGYVEDSLMPGEAIIMKAKPHWAMFVAPSLVTGLCGLTQLASLHDKGRTLNVHFQECPPVRSRIGVGSILVGFDGLRWNGRADADIGSNGDIG